MYGLIISVGILISTWYAEQEAKIKKIDSDLVWEVLLWCLISGIVGARLFHVLEFWDFYKFNLMFIPQIWSGGMGIMGGITGGLIGLGAYSIKKGLNRNTSLKLLDLAGASLPLGQSIGRWANYFNQEVFGLPTNLPWAIHIPIDRRPDWLMQYQTFHPLFLYESLGCLIIFVLLFLIKYRFKKIKLIDGDIFLLYLFTYGSLRYLLEPLRISHWEISGLGVVSLLSLILISVSGSLIFLRRFKT